MCIDVRGTLYISIPIYKYSLVTRTCLCLCFLPPDMGVPAQPILFYFILSNLDLYEILKQINLDK